jgi:hypothetical protein
MGKLETIAATIVIILLIALLFAASLIEQEQAKPVPVQPAKVVSKPNPVCKLIYDLEADPHIQKAIADDLIEIESNCHH